MEQRTPLGRSNDRGARLGSDPTLSAIKGAKSDGDVSIGCSDVSAGICNIVDDISLSHQTTVSKIFSDIQQDKHQSNLHLIRRTGRGLAEAERIEICVEICIEGAGNVLQRINVVVRSFLMFVNTI